MTYKLVWTKVDIDNYIGTVRETRMALELNVELKMEHQLLEMDHQQCIECSLSLGFSRCLALEGCF